MTPAVQNMDAFKRIIWENAPDKFVGRYGKYF